jgi:hypothetical protein
LRASIFAMSSRSLTSSVGEEETRQVDDRGERRAQLVADVGEEARLRLGELSERQRALIELGIQRDDAAVRLGQLLREALQVRLAGAQQGAQLPHLRVEVGGGHPSPLRSRKASTVASSRPRV